MCFRSYYVSVIKQMETYREGVKSPRNGLTAEFDADGVLACIFHLVVDADGSIAVIHDVYVQIAVKSQIKFTFAR